MINNTRIPIGLGGGIQTFLSLHRTRNQESRKERLNHLSLMSIESELFKKVEFEDRHLK